MAGAACAEGALARGAGAVGAEPEEAGGAAGPPGAGTARAESVAPPPSAGAVAARGA